MITPQFNAITSFLSQITKLLPLNLKHWQTTFRSHERWTHEWRRQTVQLFQQPISYGRDQETTGFAWSGNARLINLAGKIQVSLFAFFQYLIIATFLFLFKTNVFLQLFLEISIRKMHQIIKQVIKGIANLDGFPHYFNIAEGCSSGPNTILVVSNIINEVHDVCKDKNLKTPQF